MSVLWLDTETFGTADLPSVGAYVYHQTSELMLVQYAIDQQSVEIWQPVLGEPIPQRLIDFLSDPRVLIVAQNVDFDRLALMRGGLNVPASRWWDSVCMLTSMGLPARLAAAGARLGLSEDKRKMADGTQLIRLFCMPQGKGARKGQRIYPWEEPHEWQRFVQYGMRDVDAMRTIVSRIKHRHSHRSDLPRERQVFDLHQAINDRGFPVDRAMLRAAAVLTKHAARIGDEAIQRYTKNYVQTTGQVQKIKEWLTHRGVEPERITSLGRAVIGELLTAPELFDVHDVLETRLTYARSSTAKYSAMLEHVNDDDRIRNAYRYQKAHTGRWAGAGAQPHNLTRPQGELSAAELAQAVHDSSGDPQHPTIQAALNRGYTLPDLLAYALRGAIKAPPGRVITVADYPQVEARMTHWLAGNDTMTQAFRDPAVDPYKVAYAEMGNVPINAVTPSQRFLGKVTTLGCGYQMGGPKFYRTCALIHGMRDMTLELANETVANWRVANAAVPLMWRTLFNELLQFFPHLGTAAPTHQQLAIDYQVQRVDPPLRTNTLDLVVNLPSGRRLYYADVCARTKREIIEEITDPEIQSDMIKNLALWCKARGFTVNWALSLPTITYQAEFNRHALYGGKQTENWVQALCRDLIAESMLEVDACLPSGAFIIGHTHDEMMVEHEPAQTDAVHAIMSAAIQRAPPWAQGMPLGAPELLTNERYPK